MKRVSIGAAWTEAHSFVKREAGLLFPVILLFVAIPMALIFLAVPAEMRNMSPGAATVRPAIPGASLLLIVACSMIIIAGTLTCYALALKPGISMGEALALGFRRLPAGLAAAALVGVALGIPMLFLTGLSGPVGTMLMLVLIFVFSARLMLLNAIIVDRSCGPVQALRASWEMSRGNTGRLLLFLVGITLPILLAQVVSELLLGLLGLALGGPDIGRQTGDIGAAAALAIGQVFLIVMTVRLYRQLAA